MLKKLVVTAIAAAAMTVPLAGVAWAAPSTDAGSNGNGIGAGGVPVNSTNGPPGSLISSFAMMKQPGQSLPVAFGGGPPGPQINTPGHPK